MKTSSILVALLMLALVAGCPGEMTVVGTDTPIGTDGGPRDGGAMDAPGLDAPMATMDAPSGDDAPSADDTGGATDDAPAVVDDGGVVTLDAPVSMPDAPASMPDAPASMPDAPAPVDAPVAMRDAPAAMPDAPAAPQFCDVVYAVGSGACGTAGASETGRFHSIKTGLGAMNTVFDVGLNCTSPRRGTLSAGGGGTNVATPFTPTAFPRGYVRLRFPAAGGMPAAGRVELIEYYMPVEFTVNSFGTMVFTDVDHSAGLLSYSTTCGTGITGCIAGASDTTAPTLSRRCAPVAAGMLSGTTLMWGMCPVATPAACSGTGCTATMAQLNWTAGMSQDTASSAGCLTNENSWGGISCMGGACGFVPGLGAPTNLTWDQRLPNLTFSSASYGAAGTTVTIGEMTIPDEPSDVYSGTQVVTATMVHVECGAVAALTCDDE